MQLDPFSVLVAFLALLEAALGGTALLLGLREARAPAGGAADAAAEGRRPLLALAAGALVGIAAASVPLLYLLLASWVPRWPGIMCVEGVRRIGLGTEGPSRFLPTLAAALDASKFLLLLAAGAWAVLRRAPGAARGAALAAAALGLVALLDGAAALAFVAIPREEALPAGCCPVEVRAESREAGLTAAGAAPEGGGAGGTAAAYLAGAALLGGAAGAGLLRGGGGRGRAAGLGLLALLAAASLPLAARFLSDVAAPAVLRLPFHRCAWCAFASAPETLVGAALHVGAALAAGWAAAGRLAAPPGPDPPAVRSLLLLSSFGFLGSAAMAAVVLALR